jgi:LPS-assembly protein
MRAILLGLCLAAAATTAAAQEAPNLLADDLLVTADGDLVASGNVEVWFQGTRLTARAIRYDPATDRLTIDGPILITTPDGAILAADSASLDPALQDGLLSGARLILDRQVQLAANRIDRIEGRYSALTQAAVTACRVCPGRAPLWEIRAARVIHDQDERQLYFENATLRVMGLPILWLPRMRLPDPTLDRATGFLIPQLRSTDRLGTGIRLPFFLALGDHRDLTLTPYLSAETRTIGWRYRQAYPHGDLSFAGALSRDSIRPDEWRGYVLAEGRFALASGAEVSFDIEGATDPAYLLDYGLSDKDRLDSALSYLRVGEDGITRATLTYFTTLRAGDDQGSLPPLTGSFLTERRLDWGGGRLALSADGQAFYRPDTTPGDQGRDMIRLGAGADWQRQWLIGPGALVTAGAGLRGDLYQIAQDDQDRRSLAAGLTQASATLRWPLVARAPGGATTLVEPVVALTWSAPWGDTPPNEDGLLVEFDEGNLLAPDGLPGRDLRPEGLAIAAGLTWTHRRPDGRMLSLAFGRQWLSAPSGLPAASGLDGTRSDWLLAARADLGDNLSFRGRSLLDDSLSFGKTEARLDWQGDRVTLGATYVFLPGDPDEGRSDDLSEWAFDSTVRVTEAWTLSAAARYDLIADRPAEAALGLVWQGDCVTVDLSARRRYTDSDDLDPTTDFGLSVTLNGFSVGRTTATPPGSCTDDG